MSEKLLKIGEVSSRFGLSIEALREWDASGKLVAHRTPGGHRRYRLEDVQSVLGLDVEGAISDMPVAVYVRVSSYDQKKAGDLDRQKGRVLHHCVERGYTVGPVLEEVGSGLSSKRAKLRRLFHLASEGKISRIVIEHQDRLTRFMFDIFVVFFDTYGVEVEWVEDTLPKSYEAERVEDILTLMASFSAKIYGRRSAKNRRKSKR